MMLLIEDLERVHLKLQMEAARNETDESLAKRLIDMSMELDDALFRAKSLLCEKAVSEPVDRAPATSLRPASPSALSESPPAQR
jgi:hypothetical protein